MSKKRALRFTILVLATLLALTSCATLKRDERGVEGIARLVNAGQAERLTAMSTLPFLLDQEILVLPQDVAFFWKSILAVGYRLEEPRVERSAAVGPDSYRQFRDSLDARAFFKKYVKKGTRLLELRTGDGRRVFLLVRARGSSRQISGFKGPF